MPEEVMPIVEQHYNASTRREDRALAGLSMGGEATLIGLNHLDTFAWVGSFSGAFNLWPLTRPATPPRPVPPAAGEGPAVRTPAPLRLEAAGLPTSSPALNRAANATLRLLWITCGTGDVLIGVHRDFKRYLDAQGVRATYIEVADAGHVWPFWRQNLADFAPLLFK